MAATEPRGILPESIWIAVICVVDMASTVALFLLGMADEANPLLRPHLHYGVAQFVAVKSLSFLVPIVGLEWLRAHRPDFVTMMMRLAIIGYLLIYFGGSIAQIPAMLGDVVP